MRRRSLAFLITTILALIIAVFISGTLNAPESDETETRYRDGDRVSLSGQLVCLPHRDARPGQPVTMECAFGFRDESGVYYAVEDTSENYSLISNTPMHEPVRIEGTYRPNPDTKYSQNGTIQIISVIR